MQLGDLPEIRERGVLRVARQAYSGYTTLPGEGIQLQKYERVAEAFAERLGVRVDWVEIAEFVPLLNAARDGRADLVVGNLSITPERALLHRFSLPLSRSSEWLIGAAQDSADATAAQEGNAPRIGLPPGTVYHRTAASRGLTNVVEIEDVTPDQVFEAMAAGQFEQTIIDAVTARGLLDRYPQFAKLDELISRPLAWVMRQDSVELGEALDTFIIEEHLGERAAALEHRDLPALQAVGVLRLITVTGPHTYFLYKGELMGFDYELVQRFAERHDLKVSVIVAADRRHALRLLEDGAGDLIAAGVTPLASRYAQGWRFTDPYLFVDEMLVTAPGGPDGDVASAEAAPTPTLTLNRTTSHWSTAQNLGFAVEETSLSTDAILERVAEGEVAATIVDSQLLDIMRAAGLEFGAAESVRQAVGLAWGVRPDQPELLAAANAFIADDYRSLGYNLLRRKYFDNARRIARREVHRVSGGLLSPYDQSLQRLGAQHAFDWRLLVSQVYQESEFKPKRTSFAGARGLMQVMPRTARQLGVSPDDLFKVEPGLDAGVRYLAWCRERFQDELPIAERTWFALAAYNAGAGHVHDARRLATELGLNRDVWFGNVEEAMLKLSLPKYYRQASFGYVRGREPTNYVREIRQRYQAYVDHLRTL